MRKGFTLLELLGIIILLGVIILVAVPSLIQSNKNAEINEQKEFDNTINHACQLYLQVHTKDYNDLLNTYNKQETIPAETLIKEGYLKGTLKNPKSEGDNNTLQQQNGQITATNKNGEITCTYSYIEE